MILVTGRGTSGSFQIRGVQLGAAIGATVEPDAKECEGYDAAIIVKRWRSESLHRIRTAGVPIIWDILDSWSQPYGNEWNKDQCLAWLHGQIEVLRPSAIVAATQAMAEDCADFKVPVLALPHHARPGQAVNPIREEVRCVGYEGGVHYLGKWEAIIRRECEVRGWTFTLNPASLADLDIVVALREAKGYAARNWKSNCKLANAQGSGTPCVLSLEAGYMETMSGVERWAETSEELAGGFGDLSSHEVRLKVSQHMLKSAPSLERIAEKYKEWLSAL